MKLEALIFDVDGTLAETEELHRQAFNDTFQQAGLPWRWDRERYSRLLTVTGGKERMRHYIDAWRPQIGNELTDAEIAGLHKQKTLRYGELMARGDVTLRPGVAELLQQARMARLPLAIATTTSSANVAALLHSCLGAESLAWFTVIAAAEQAQAKKPAPDVYRYALDALQLPAAACLAVEDSANGLRAALAAGIPTLVTPGMYTAGQDFRGALEVLPDLSHTDLQTLQTLFQKA